MPPKSKTNFVCQSCGAVFARWMGKCAECEAWNTIVEEEIVDEGAHQRGSMAFTGASPTPITDGSQPPPTRTSSGKRECDRVLGGGIVPGSLTLVGGDPGIGKSTLMLQMSHHLAANAGKVLYVSGEESFSQARLRADRLNALHDRLFLLTETSVSAIAKEIRDNDYAFVVIDSIQSVYTSQLAAVPGSVGQIRECANEFLRLAKGHNVPIFLVGHVTKEGAIAGPRLLEHLVDTVLYFEGEGRQSLRILRAVKNRFGSTNEIGVFEMRETGLHEVDNPSALFLNERPAGRQWLARAPRHRGHAPAVGRGAGAGRRSHAGSPRRTVTGMNPGPHLAAAGRAGEARRTPLRRSRCLRQCRGRREARRARRGSRRRPGAGVQFSRAPPAQRYHCLWRGRPRGRGARGGHGAPARGGGGEVRV
jgi:DNA repair protein RadA/Sms